MAQAKTKTLHTLRHAVIVDYTCARGITSILTLDKRGYHLNGCRYGGYGWPTRDEALRQIIARKGSL